MRSRAELERLIEQLRERAEEAGTEKDPYDGPLPWREADGELFRDAAAALSECLPEERVGACPCGMCEHVSGKWCELYPTMPDGEPEAAPVPWKHCAWCGAHLGADGVARRNADAGRVDRVRQALDEWCVDGFVAEEYIRAALGPQGGGDDD